MDPSNSLADGSIHVSLLLFALEDSSSGLYLYYFLGEAKSSTLVSRGAAMQGEQYSPLFTPPPSAHRAPPGCYFHYWHSIHRPCIFEPPCARPLSPYELHFFSLGAFYSFDYFFALPSYHRHRLLLSFIYRKEMNGLYYVPEVLSIMECKL